MIPDQHREPCSLPWWSNLCKSKHGKEASSDTAHWSTAFFNFWFALLITHTHTGPLSASWRKYHKCTNINFDLCAFFSPSSLFTTQLPPVSLYFLTCFSITLQSQPHIIFISYFSVSKNSSFVWPFHWIHATCLYNLHNRLLTLWYLLKCSRICCLNAIFNSIEQFSGWTQVQFVPAASLSVPCSSGTGVCT